jgi:TRAP-type C4-dicarboxylate transport system substrate-binding protein
MKFHEHLKYITLDGHAYMGALWMMNNDFFESLSAEEKKIVEDGFDALRWTTIVLPKRRQIEAYETFKQAGGTVYVPTEEEKAEFVSAAKPVWDWYVGKFGDDWLKALQASIDRCVAAIDAQRAS